MNTFAEHKCDRCGYRWDAMVLPIDPVCIECKEGVGRKSRHPETIQVQCPVTGMMMTFNVTALPK